MPQDNPKFRVHDIVKWTDDYGSTAMVVGRVDSIKKKEPNKMFNGGYFYRIKVMNRPWDKRLYTVPEHKLEKYGSSIKTTTSQQPRERS